MARWRFILVALACVALCFFISVNAKVEKDVTELQIGVKFKPKTCEIKAHKGDKVNVHYRDIEDKTSVVIWTKIGIASSALWEYRPGALTDGSVFDASYDRGEPIDFTLGTGQVIKGWDQGLLGACLGEKRKLKIPSKLGYGPGGSPPKIPGGATLIFDTELVGINGKTYSDGHSEL